MRHALSVALQGFVGAMVIVSHDRHLLKTVTDELVIVHDGKAEAFDGDLDDYAVYIKESISQLEKAQESTKDSGEPIIKELSKKEQRQLDAERRKQLQPLNNKLKKLEKALDELSQTQSELEEILADTDLYTDENKNKLKKTLLEKSEVDKKLEQVEFDWMEVSEEYENAQSAISI